MEWEGSYVGCACSFGARGDHWGRVPSSMGHIAIIPVVM